VWPSASKTPEELVKPAMTSLFLTLKSLLAI
jgi:hypothetical protein